MTQASQRVVDTPLGRMLLRAQGGALTGAWFLDQADCPPGAADGADANGQHPDSSTASPRAGQSATSCDEYAVPPPRDGCVVTTSTDEVVGTTLPGTYADTTSAEGYADTTSPEGYVGATSSEAGVHATSPGRRADATVLDHAALELAEYFDGGRRQFSLAMAPQGTPFQRRVWDALRDVPFGSLESYGALAARCAQSAAVRAVAQAVGRNPISIFIPCHRIVGGDSALTGFGGGLARKQALLSLEGHAYATSSPRARRATPDPRQGKLW
jgi:methylated-DNA-[protein]-cysteine S-methyltransferase